MIVYSRVISLQREKEEMPFKTPSAPQECVCRKIAKGQFHWTMELSDYKMG